MKLHAGHVLHALDPSVEPRGPASGYGAKKAAAGALQHVGFAAAAEGATPGVKNQAAVVTATLNEANGAIDRAIAAAQNLRSAVTPADGAALARDLPALITAASAGLEKAHEQMRALMKTEGL